MIKISQHRVAIQQGDTILFSDFEQDGVMWTGDGPRQTRVHVAFAEPFVSAPAVHAGLSMWDISNDAYARADITTEDITAKGFAVVFRTWGDTKVARARVNWLAIGPARDDEDWELG